MKELDMELSQEVAKQAGEKISKAKEELQQNKDSFILFLREMIDDSKEHVKFLRRIIISLLIIILVLISGMVALNIYNQNAIKKMSKENNQQLMDFITQTDFYYEVEMLNEYSDFNYNNVSSK